MIHNNSVKEKYLYIMNDLRNKTISTEILSKERNQIMIESTSLQLRMILELISYLFVVVNQDKFNSKQKEEWSPTKFIENLQDKVSVFYPTPCYVIEDETGEPTVIPRGFQHALNISELKEAYKNYNNALHAFHPFKTKKLTNDELWVLNTNVIKQVKELLANHIITIKESGNLYSFLHSEIDFNDNEKVKPIYIKQYKVNITNEEILLKIFGHQLK
jgi:hypothetical protein